MPFKCEGCTWAAVQCSGSGNQNKLWGVDAQGGSRMQLSAVSESEPSALLMMRGVTVTFQIPFRVDQTAR